MKQEAKKESPSIPSSVVSFVLFSEALHYYDIDLLPKGSEPLQGLEEITAALILLDKKITTKDLSWCFPLDALNDLYCEGFIVFPTGDLLSWPHWQDHAPHKNEALCDFTIGFLAFLLSEGVDEVGYSYAKELFKVRSKIKKYVDMALTIPLTGSLLSLKQHYVEAIKVEPSIKETLRNVHYLLDGIRESEAPMDVKSLVAYLAIKEKGLS